MSGFKVYKVPRLGASEALIKPLWAHIRKMVLIAVLFLHKVANMHADFQLPNCPISGAHDVEHVCHSGRRLMNTPSNIFVV